MNKAEAANALQRAAKLYQAERYAEALDLLDRCAECFPDAREVLYARALCLAHVGRHGEAAELCDQLIARFNDLGSVELKRKLASPQQLDLKSGAKSPEDVAESIASVEIDSQWKPPPPPSAGGMRRPGLSVRDLSQTSLLLGAIGLALAVIGFVLGLSNPDSAGLFVGVGLVYFMVLLARLSQVYIVAEVACLAAWFNGSLALFVAASRLFSGQSSAAGQPLLFIAAHIIGVGIGFLVMVLIGAAVQVLVYRFIGGMYDKGGWLLLVALPLALGLIFTSAGGQFLMPTWRSGIDPTLQGFALFSVGFGVGAVTVIAALIIGPVNMALTTRLLEDW